MIFYFNVFSSSQTHTNGTSARIKVNICVKIASPTLSPTSSIDWPLGSRDVSYENELETAIAP